MLCSDSFYLVEHAVGEYAQDQLYRLPLSLSFAFHHYPPDYCSTVLKCTGVVRGLSVTNAKSLVHDFAEIENNLYIIFVYVPVAL